MKHWTSIGAVLFSMLSAIAGSTNAAGFNVKLGRSSVRLNGPWRFHIGDNLRWSRAGFNDSNWRNVSFSAPRDANDGDIGIGRYAPGWSAKGYPGYHGFAWYRMGLTLASPKTGRVELLGPWAVDSAYQLYANGRLLGGVGDVSTTPPRAYSYHYPRMFVLPLDVSNARRIVLALRVWAGPWVSGSTAGGIHIAPMIGERGAIAARYRLQWLKVFEGYVTDASIALMFVALAIVSICLVPFDRADHAYLWLAAALIFSAIQRGNQAIFFWLEIETVRDYVYFIAVLVGSLTLAAWTMAWRAWFRLDAPSWLPKAIASLTLALMIAQMLVQPWLFAFLIPTPVVGAASDVITAIHLFFLIALIAIGFAGIVRQPRIDWFAVPVIAALCPILFSAELSALHVPEIWFPWGVGVSLSEYASVLFGGLLFCLLMRRLWNYA